MTDLELTQKCADALQLKYFAQSWTGGVMHYVGQAGAAEVRDFNPLEDPAAAEALDPEGKFGDMRFPASRRLAVIAMVMRGAEP